MGLQDMQVGIVDNARTCGYSVALALLTTHLSLLQCRATRQYGATLLTEGGVTG
jgi:hypothetical protein